MATKPATVTLTPYELADLLGIDRADAGALSPADVTLPAGFPAAWRDRTGPHELTGREAAAIAGVVGRTIGEWCRCRGLVARLVGGDWRITPQALVTFLRAKSGAARLMPQETPTQRQKRGRDAKARALAS